MSRIDEISDAYVDSFARLDPTSAVGAGITGHEGRTTEYTPEAFAARAELDRRTLAEITAERPADEREQVAREALRERLELAVELYDAGDLTSELNVVAGPLQDTRQIFDLLDAGTPQGREAIASRLAQVATAYAQLKTTLAGSAKAGRTAARRQVLACANQCDMWNRDDFWGAVARNVAGAGDVGEELERSAASAREATADFARFLREELLSSAPEKDAVGRERYARSSRYFLGDEVDLEETYAWGLSEVARIKQEMAKVAKEIVPGGTVADALAALEADPSRHIAGKEAFRDWMQERSDEAVEALADSHFDIPEPVRKLECMIAPTNDGVMYYTGPSEDFSRPGRMWWSVPEGQDSFATWREVTTVYHEGVPGHHLQIAQTAYRSAVLNRYRRSLCWVSGHGEGWALYAERLMEELGFMSDPADRLGLLDSQMLRAGRVVVDIGMHLELEIPRGTGFHDGERWTPQLGWEFMRDLVEIEDGQLRFELDRYLGWPGQAPSYKVGERSWLQAREEAKQRQGAGFDLKDFHRQALDLGSIGLRPLREALARI